MAEDIEKWLVDWFLAQTGMTSEDLPSAAAENYFEKGWMDSLKFVDFIADIEAEFGIQFDNDQFQAREFSTLYGLAGIIGSARGAPGKA